MKTVVSVFLCMLMMLCASSAQLWAAAPAPKQVLERVAGMFRKAGGIEMSFTIEAPEGASEGKILLKGEKFRLETGGITTWFDGQTQWSYVEVNDEVNVSEPTPQELQSINPYALLQLYKQGYALQMGSVTELNAKPVYEVILTAEDKTADFRQISVLVDRQTYRPLRISFVQQGNSALTTVSLASFRDRQSYDDRQFVFDAAAYPSAEVIDLR